MSKINLKYNPFDDIYKDWGVVTSGKIDNYNAMTIGWGSLGTLWSKNVVSIYIKPIRYTWNFLKENEYFTVSFYEEEYRKDLSVLGTKSGKDCDKVTLTSLSVKQIENALTFNEAKLTFVCKKLYMAKLEADAVPEDIHDHYYVDEEEHYLIVGEIELIEENNSVIYKK